MVRYPDRIQVRVPLDDPEDQASLRRAIARETGCSPESLPDVRLIRRAIDARGSRIWLNLELDLGPSVSKPSRGLQPIRGEPKTLIIGDGPAGLFCAYELALSGQSSLVIDRGKKVQPRRRDLKLLNQFGEVPADSNYCFGEGGAGTYSDGKLYTRSQKRGDPQAVLDILAYHGAPAQILTDARPHIGSNKLPKVITSMREALEDVGIQFRFETRVEGLKIRNGRCVGVRIAGGEVILAENIVIATGHSAVDVFHFLDRAGVALEAKPFAVGVRIEHPQPLIDRLQYKTHAGHPKLPAASYKLAAKIDHRSVYSFCMCPGGWIVPSSTSADGLVVNGMSLSRRDSPFANSGLVVNVTPADLETSGFTGLFGGVHFQQKIEHTAFLAGGGQLRAPATRVTDFLQRRASNSVPNTSYIPGLQAVNLDSVLDCGPCLSDSLRQGLQIFGTKMPGYLTEEAVLVGIESRTSCPIRIPRDARSLQSSTMPGLYPAGEGAGYAGGIVSAAIDGIRIAKAIVAAQRHAPLHV